MLITREWNIGNEYRNIGEPIISVFHQVLQNRIRYINVPRAALCALGPKS
jgi:hypothetical protein